MQKVWGLSTKFLAVLHSNEFPITWDNQKRPGTTCQVPGSECWLTVWLNLSTVMEHLWCGSHCGKHVVFAFEELIVWRHHLDDGITVRHFIRDCQFLYFCIFQYWHLAGVWGLSRSLVSHSLRPHRLAHQASTAPVAHHIPSSKLVKPYLLLKILKYFHTCW